MVAFHFLMSAWVSKWFALKIVSHRKKPWQVGKKTIWGESPMITLRNPILTNPAYKRVETRITYLWRIFIFEDLCLQRKRELRTDHREKRWVEIFHDSEDIFTWSSRTKWWSWEEQENKDERGRGRGTTCLTLWAKQEIGRGLLLNQSQKNMRDLITRH